LIIAQAMINDGGIDEVWFIVSPQNPLKDSNSIIHHFDRIDMVELAIENNNRFKASDIEFNLPVPSYTINTLAHLSEKFPGKDYKLIIGEDNLANFHKWKNHDQILEHYGLLVYRRIESEESTFASHPNVTFIEAPLINISATFIRKKIRQQKSYKYLVPDKVENFIRERKLYL
jgi:nicotinate-nucleotide adenylyltransferase